MLESLEMHLCLRRVARALQGPRQGKFSRSVQRIHFERMLQRRDGLVELLHLLVANALKINGVHVPGIELHGALKAGQCRLQFVARVLGQAQVVPRLRAVWVECNPLLQRLLRLVNPLQREQRYALIHRRLRQLRVLFERRGKTIRGALGKLLAHLRHTAIVEPHCLGVKARLRPGRGHTKENKCRSQNYSRPILSQLLLQCGRDWAPSHESAELSSVFERPVGL